MTPASASYMKIPGRRFALRRTSGIQDCGYTAAKSGCRTPGRTRNLNTTCSRELTLLLAVRRSRSPCFVQIIQVALTALPGFFVRTILQIWATRQQAADAPLCKKATSVQPHPRRHFKCNLHTCHKQRKRSPECFPTGWKRNVEETYRQCPAM